MSSITWKAIGVSVTGFTHLAADEECQDAHRVLAVGGTWLIAIVADGAGSARWPAQGAKSVCNGLAAFLERSITSSTDPDFLILSETRLRPLLEQGIESVRESLCAMTGDSRLTDFHSTVVGAVAGPCGGFLFHIGDGVGVATTIDGQARVVVSPPENGEYSNETYFFTEESWREHLRLTPIDEACDLILLMSDGVSPFAMAPSGREPFGPFLSPVSAFLRAHDQRECEQALTALLSRDQVRAITGDDKTLVWAWREPVDAAV